MRFFFYGTLQAGNSNPAIAAIHCRLNAEGPACISGQIVAVPDNDGWFPALIPGEGEVHGQVYAASPDFTAEDLAALDRYEEYDPASPATSWYLRETRTLTTGVPVSVYPHERRAARWCRANRRRGLPRLAQSPEPAGVQRPVRSLGLAFRAIPA